MTKKIKLTPIQKRCLVALRDAGGIATFTGQDARRLGFGVLKRNDGRGVVIRVYGTPQYFLAQKGLIHRESEKEYANFIITDEGHKAIARTKPERKPGVADALANAWRGGKPGDVPRFVPDNELNTGPRDERGHLKPGEPRTLADRLADLFEHGALLLKEFRNGETHTLSNHDRDAVVEALRTARLFEDAMNIYEVRHDGHYLGGVSVVVAESEEQAIALTIPAIKEHGVTDNSPKVVRKLDLDKPRCYVLDDGDY